MKSKLLKFLMVALGFGAYTSCDAPDMYGCPNADYVFNVDIVDNENDAPIEGIRVSAIEKKEYQYWDSETGMATYETHIDTLALGTTDANGKVVLTMNAFPRDKHTIAADDVDGAENGSYTSSSVVLTTDKDDYKEPGNSGWYSGTATHDVTLKLNKKTE